MHKQKNLVLKIGKRISHRYTVVSRVVSLSQFQVPFRLSQIIGTTWWLSLGTL